MSDSGTTSTRPVLIDTDVFSKVFVSSATNPQRQKWSTALAGRTVTIAVQTEVELRAWPELKGWGVNRTEALLTQVMSLGTIQVTAEVQAKFVSLTVWSKENGHGLFNKVHTADRWIAATALAYDLELAAGDGIYDHVEGLQRFHGIP